MEIYIHVQKLLKPDELSDREQTMKIYVTANFSKIYSFENYIKLTDDGMLLNVKHSQYLENMSPADPLLEIIGNQKRNRKRIAPAEECPVAVLMLCLTRFVFPISAKQKELTQTQ